MEAGPRIVILGGTGVFGGLVAEELADLPLVIGSRNLERARAAAAKLPRAEGRRIDLEGPLEFHDASVVVHCAGPYRGQDLRVVEACERAGAWYVDLADEKPYLDRVAGRPRVLAGMSSIPGLAVTLARALGGGTARAFLYIGNRNAKGSAAFTTLLKGIQRGGWSHREFVRFPFGLRAMHHFESPVPGMEFKVGFELPAVNRLFSLARELFRMGVPLPPAGPLLAGANLLSGPGTGMGCLLVETPRGRAWALSTNRGQRMAAIPAALAARLLHEGGSLRPLPDTFEPGELFDALRRRDFEVVVELFP